MGRIRRPAALQPSRPPGFCRSRYASVLAGFCTVLLMLGVSYSFSEQKHSAREAAHAVASYFEVAGLGESLTAESGAAPAGGAFEAAPRLNASQVAKPAPALPSRTAPVNAVFLAAKGVDAPDLLRTLASLSESVPDALVVLICSHAEAHAVLPRVVARGTSPAAGQLALHLLMYNWAAVDALQSSDIRGRPAPLERYSLYAWILEDIRSGLAQSAALPAPGAILANTAPLAYVDRGLDGVMLCDARDVVFQRDPFPEMWARAKSAGAMAGSEGLTLSMQGAAPSAPLWGPELSALPVVIVAQEVGGRALGDENWNRAWVHLCAGYLGEALVNDKTIYCSGTTLGTAAGMSAYLSGVFAVALHCSDIVSEKGIDQGIHNIMLQRRTPAEWETALAWVAPGSQSLWGALEGIKPYKASPAMIHREAPVTKVARPGDFVSLLASIQSRITVLEAAAEDGYICTLAELVKAKGMTRDVAGHVTKLHDPTVKCAVVHQMDRFHELDSWFRGRYKFD